MAAESHSTCPVDFDAHWYNPELVDDIHREGVARLQEIGLTIPAAVEIVAGVTVDALQVGYMLDMEARDNPIQASVRRLDEGLGLGRELAVALTGERLLGALLRELAPHEVS